MAATIEQIQTARAAGHSDEEILGYLTSKGLIDTAKAKVATDAGYGAKEILDHFSPSKPFNDRAATDSLPKSLGGFQDAIRNAPSYHGHSDNPMLDSLKTAGAITGGVGLALGGAGAIAGATLKGFLTSLAAGTATGAAAGKAAKWLELPGWAQTAAELLGGAAGMSATGRLSGLLKEYIQTRPSGPVNGFIDFLLSKNAAPEAEAITKLIHEPTGVTGGAPIPSSGPSSYPPGDPNAIPGPGLWQRSGPKLPRSVEPILPDTRRPAYPPGGTAETGPGFSGTRLPGATGRGANSQSPLPQVPQARVIIESPNPPTPSDYIFVGGEQYQIPGTAGYVEAPVDAAGPTGKLPTAPKAKSPTSPPPDLSERDHAALKLGSKILDTQDDKSRLIANYWKQNGIDPATVDEVVYRGHEKAVGKGPSRDVANSLARTRKTYESLPSDVASNGQVTSPSPSLLEDTLKKSIKKAQSPESPKGIKASKTTTTKAKGASAGSSPLPAIPSAPPVESGTFTYGGDNPTWEFKRTGPGSWHQRDFGTDSPFTPVTGPVGLDLEDSLTNNELVRRSK